MKLLTSLMCVFLSGLSLSGRATDRNICGGNEKGLVGGPGILYVESEVSDSVLFGSEPAGGNIRLVFICDENSGSQLPLVNYTLDYKLYLLSKSLVKPMADASQGLGYKEINQALSLADEQGMICGD